MSAANQKQTLIGNGMMGGMEGIGLPELKTLVFETEVSVAAAMSLWTHCLLEENDDCFYIFSFVASFHGFVNASFRLNDNFILFV